jgi:hypothetical protein
VCEIELIRRLIVLYPLGEQMLKVEPTGRIVFL